MRTRKLLRDLAVGLAVTAVLFLLLEGLLWALGLGAGRPDRELSRGFDPAAQYFVPDPEKEGVIRTQLHGSQTQKERRIHPKHAPRRVLLFGGSNTQMLDAKAFAWALNRDLDPPQYEVINLGREGYGSERVRILFGQALQLLEPDLVVIYSGHNEFVERGFELDLEQSGPAPWMQRAAAVASHTRTFNTLVDLFDRERPSGGRKPEDWEWEYSKFEDLKYAETLQYLDAYQENIEEMVQLAQDRGVRVLVSTVVHNRLAAPFVSNLPADTPAEAAREFDGLLAEVLGELPAVAADLLPLKEQDRVHGFDWEARRAEHGVQGPIREMAAPEDLPGRRPGTGPFEGAQPGFPAPRFWAPKVRVFYEALERFWARDFNDDERAALNSVRPKVERLLELCPDHPQAHFVLGLLTYLEGGGEDRVKAAFERAARFDRAPRKASEATNERVREVASRHPDALFVDADELFCGRVPGGLFDWSWMIDHCHINQTARLVLLYDWADAVRESWPPAPR